MKTKKQNWLSENAHFIFLVLFIGAIILFVLSESNSTFYFCSKNPNKCVCEEKCQDSWRTNNGEIKRLCFDNFLYISEGYHPDKCSQFRKKTQTELNIDGCNNNPREDSNCKCEEYSRPTCSGSGTTICNATECKTFFIESQQNCIKSRPKTECERKNPD